MSCQHRKFRNQSPRSLRHRLERASSGLVFGMGMILLLTAFAGYLYDVRRIALAQIHAQSTLDLAAYRAGNDIDIPHFKTDQDVLLAPDAEGIAVNTIRSARQTEYSLNVTGVQTLYGGAFMEVRGEMSVPLGFMSRSLGIGEAKRKFLTIIEPSYGIQHKYD
jgi:hypothetical protein